MSSLLAKRIFPSSDHHHHHYLSLFPSFLRLSLSTQRSTEEMPFLASYLISRIGLLPDRALKISAYRYLVGIKTADQPNSVVSFLQDAGLSDSQLKRAVSFCPELLSYNVERTLRPRYNELIAAGFSQELIVSLLHYSSKAMRLKKLTSSLYFWRNFVGNNDDLLSKVIRMNAFLMTLNIDKHVLPRINLLKEFGLSNESIVILLTVGMGCMHRTLESLRRIVEQTEELGFSRGSIMFVHGLHVVGSHRKEILEKKMKFFKSAYGWSEEEISSAFKKFPLVLAYSEEKVKITMEFLMRKVKLEPS